jgi:hypothetical protein
VTGQLNQNLLTPENNTKFIYKHIIYGVCVFKKSYLCVLTELDGRHNSRNQTHQKSFCVVNSFTGSGARSTPFSVDRIRDKVNDLAL